MSAILTVFVYEPSEYICIMYTHMGISIIRGIIRQSIYQIYIFRPKGRGGGGDYSTLLFSFSVA